MTETEKKRLLVLTSTFPRWAADPEPGFVFELSRRLTSAYQVTVLAPRSPGAADTETMNRVTVRRFPYCFRRFETLAGGGGGILGRLGENRWLSLLLPLLLLGQIIATARQLRRDPPHCIHAHWLLPQGLSAVLARAILRDRTPILCTSHGGDLYGLQARPWRWLKRFVLRRVQHMAVVSRAMVDEIERQGLNDSQAPTPVSVAPMGVDLQSLFTPPKDENERADNTLLFVGRLVEKKGVDVLLRALPEVVARHPTLRLHIAGGGPLETELKQLVEQQDMANHIRFLGPQPQSQLPALYRNATLLVAPFRVARGGDQEGLGLVPVEALGCGCPVVASDLPALHDVFGQRTYALVPPDEPSALAERIADLLDDAAQRGRMAIEGRAHCIEHFDWESVAMHYQGIIERTSKGSTTSATNHVHTRRGQ